MSIGLPPPPTRAPDGSFAWTSWYNQLYTLLSTTGAVQWSQVNKSGSSISDLQNHDHNLLSNIQGGTSGQYYHLTAAQVALIGVGNHNDLNAIQGGSALERYHLSAAEYNYVHNTPYIEVADTMNTITLSTTPTVLIPPTTVGGTGISYDNTTGIFTFNYTGNYTLVVSVNATSSAANQSVYIFAELNTGSGWNAIANSGKSVTLVNAQSEQISFANAVHRLAGQQIRYKVYSNSNKVTLSTTALPGSVGASVPTIRIQYST